MIVIIFGHEHYINKYEFRNSLDTATAAAGVMMYTNTNSNWARGTLYCTTDSILDCLSLKGRGFGGREQKTDGKLFGKKVLFQNIK